MPDTFSFPGANYKTEEMIYRPELAPAVGMQAFAGTLALTPAGQITHGNHLAPTIPVIKATIQEGRNLRMQSLNNYRRFDNPSVGGALDNIFPLTVVYGKVVHARVTSRASL